MITLAPGLGVYLACGVTDMRTSMVGLAMLVQQTLGADPFDGVVFAFRGRRTKCELWRSPRNRDSINSGVRGKICEGAWRLFRRTAQPPSRQS